MGLEPATFERLMAELGFRAARGEGGWVWRGRPPARPTTPTPSSANAFASLAEMFAR
jgi:ATP-dependent RNA helicase SUPV3L1/SUV3